MPQMTYDFFMGQLRLIVISFLAFSAGKGWLSTADSTFATAVLTPLGLIAGPWIWSVYRNLGKKLVPSEAVAVMPLGTGSAAQVAGANVGDHISIDAAKVVGAIVLAFMLAAFVLPSQAFAQVPKPRLFTAIETRIDGQKEKTGGDILSALDEKFLPDLQYALRIARAGNSRVTAPCYEAWIAIIVARQKSVTDDAGNPIPEPNPHVITTFEKAVALRNALQPDSDFMIKCSPVASMVKKDIIGFMGTVISGGAGLAALGL